MLDFYGLQAEIGKWSRINFPGNKNYHPLLGLTEEVGELAHAHLKMEQGIRGNFAELTEKKMDAVGDIVIYLIDYCERNGLNFADCVMRTWDEVKQRDWQKNKETGKA